jgi:RNA polymerase sigma-70 factor (ECF subfamily)
MTQHNPQELVQRAAQRDVEAFAQLYDEHVNAVYRFVYFKVGNATLAEDLTAEVFSKAWESITRFQWRNLPFEHWLIRIARNAVVDHFRANRRPIVSIDGLFDAASSDDPPDERVGQELEFEELRRALGSLPDDQRDVVILRFIEEYSHADVAKVLNKSDVAVRQIQVRALKALRKLMTLPEGADGAPSRAWQPEPRPPSTT